MKSNNIVKRADSLDSAEAVLKWLTDQVDGDEIEDVTDEMLDKLVNGDLEGTGTVFCKFYLSRLTSRICRTY